MPALRTCLSPAAPLGTLALLIACGPDGSTSQTGSEAGTGSTAETSTGEGTGTTAETSTTTDSTEEGETESESESESETGPPPPDIPPCPVDAVVLAGVPGRPVAAGDVNGDGHLDIVSRLPDEGGMDWYAGDGLGNFAATSTGAAPAGGELVLLPDLDGNGTADLARTGGPLDDNDIHVFLSDGAGFGSVVESDFASLFYHFGTHDFDGDGRDDLVVGGFHSTPARIFRSLGDGSFELAHSLSLPACYVQSIDAADIDDDGDLDVAITAGCNSSIEDAQVALHVRNGPGFDEPVQLPTDPVDPGFVGFGELDGDGHPDLFVQGWHGDNHFGTHRGVGDGTFEPVQTQLVGAGGDSLETQVHDVDGDGLSDLLQAFSTGVIAQHNQGEGFETCSWHEGRVVASGSFDDGLPTQVIMVADGVAYYTYWAE